MEVAQPVRVLGFSTGSPGKGNSGVVGRMLRQISSMIAEPERVTIAQQTGAAKETLELLGSAKRLSFPTPIERRFREDYFQGSVGTCRFALTVGLFLYAVFGVLDRWGIPSATHVAWRIRYLVVCPSFAALLGFSWLPVFKKIMQPALAFAVIVAGLGIVAMIAVARVDEPAHTHYYAGLILVVVFGFNFVQLRLCHAFIATSITMVAYELEMLSGQKILNSPSGASLFLNSNFFFLSAHILGISAGYSLEFYRRRDFIQRQVIESDLMAAREVQRALIPDEVPEVPGLSVAAKCRTSRQVGGDYVDVVPCGPDRWLFVIADVSGKGAAAALLMANLHAIVRTRVHEMSLRETASLINDHVHRFMHQGRYITAILARYEPSIHKLTYLNAGHSGGFVVEPDGTAVLLRSTGLPLGLFREASWEVEEIDLTPGSLLMMYTDGVLDRENASGEQYGEHRLLGLARRHVGMPSELVLKSILDDSECFAEATPMADDSTLLLAGVRCAVKEVRTVSEWDKWSRPDTPLTTSEQA